MSLQDVIAQIKEQPISNVIGNYIQIIRKGRNVEAICPFHSDTKPSLKINDDKGIFKCFACSAGGDHISFVEKFKHIEFIDAVKEVCEVLHINTDSLQKKDRDPKHEMALRVLKSTGALFQKYAEEKYPDIFQHFLSSRGMTLDNARLFGIGYAPRGNVLLKYLESIPTKDRELALKIAMEIGLIKEGQRGPYDAYRHRITFPIRDQNGQIRGFSCRAIDPDDQPKYINSKDSFIFNKGQILLGFDLARIPIRQKDSVVICEGNMDVAALHQFGFDQSIAVMGIALSDFSIQKLKNMTSHFYLAMDNDQGGLNSMISINEALMREGILARKIELNPEKDPDEFLKAHGRLAFQERIDQARPFLDEYLDTQIPKPLPDSSDARVEILIQKIFPILAPLGDKLAATERAIKMAKELQLATDTKLIVDNYLAMLTKMKYQQTQQIQQPSTKNSDFNFKEKAEIITPDPDLSLENTPLNSAEKLLIKEVMHFPKLLSQETLTKCLDFVAHSEVKKIILWLRKLYLEVDDNEFVNIASNSVNYQDFSPEIRSVMAGSVFSSPIVTDASIDENDQMQKMLKDIEKTLHREQLKTRRGLLMNKSLRTKEESENSFIMQELAKIDQELLELKRK
jgi:DNA primase